MYTDFGQPAPVNSCEGIIVNVLMGRNPLAVYIYPARIATHGTQQTAYKCMQLNDLSARQQL